MRLSNIVRLYRVRLRSRIVQELFAVLGIAVGVALLFSSQVASTSLDGAVRRLTVGVIGQMRYQISARDSHGFDARLLGEVARIRGVLTAAPVLQENANVIGPAGRQSVDLIGTEPRLAYLGGALVRKLGAAGLTNTRAFILPAPIAQRIGAFSLQPVRLQIGARTVSSLLVPELLAPGSGVIAHSPIAIAPLRYAQRVTGMAGRLTSVYVRTDPRYDAGVHARLVRLARGRLNVGPADFTDVLFRKAAEPTDQSTGLFSAISALVGFLFAFNALLLTVPQRRSLVEDLRLDGYTRTMIVEVLLVDALVLGVIACALGLVLGDVMSIELFRSDPGYLAFAFPIGSQRIVAWQSYEIAVAGGFAAAVLGVLLPLRGSLLSRVGAPSRRASERRAQIAGAVPGGLACLGVTTAILTLAPQAAVAGFVSLAAALLLLMSGLLALLLAAFDRLQRMVGGAASYLATIELRALSNRARSTAIAATGAIAVFGSVAIQGAHGGLQTGLDRLAGQLNGTDQIWVAPAGEANALATTPFHGISAAALARVPGVGAVRPYRGSFLDLGTRRVWVLAYPAPVAPPLAAGQVVQGDARLAAERIRRGGWLALSQALASELGVRIGQSFVLASPRPTSFRLAAVTTNFGWPPGAVILNAGDYARAWGSGDPSAYLVTPAPRARTAAVIAAIRRALGPDSALSLQTSAARERRFQAIARQGLARLTQISTLVLIAAVLAMAAAMGSMIWQRRPQLADMKVDGFDRGVLWRGLLIESALLLGAGCSIGALFGVYGQLLLSHALVRVTGFPMVFSTGVLVALSSFALVTAVAVGIIAIPGYVAARVRPGIGLQD